MAKAVNTAEAKPGMFGQLSTFFQEVRSELQKVTWPTLEDLKVSTHVCIIMLLIMAVITYGLDLIFNSAVLAFFGLFG